VLALTPLQVPDQKDLLGGGVVLLGDLLQGLVVGQGRVGGSETRVGGEVDTLGLAELDESGGRAVDVGLTLVDGGNGLGVLQQSLQVLDTEVGDTDGPGLGRGDLLHLPPGVDKVPVLVDLGLSLTVDGVCNEGSAETRDIQSSRVTNVHAKPTHRWRRASASRSSQRSRFRDA